jgi:hypothetical protein
MRVVQALHWLRDMLSNDRERIARRLAAILADPDGGAAVVADLRAGFSSLPEWMRSFLRPLLDEASPARAMRSKRNAGARA